MNFLSIDPMVARMGAFDHEKILRPVVGRLEGVFKAHDWTCCDCGTRIPGCMQIHHSKGHGRIDDVAALRPICVFCHDVRHPIWAANRKRIVPIDAPGKDQAALNRFFWAHLALERQRESDEIADANQAEAVQELRDTLRNRRNAVRVNLETADGDSLIEALRTFYERQKASGNAAMLAEADRIQRTVVERTRWAPAIFFDDVAGNSLASWGIGGYRNRTQDVLASLPDLDNAIGELRRVGAGVMATLNG